MSARIARALLRAYIAAAAAVSLAGLASLAPPAAPPPQAPVYFCPAGQNLVRVTAGFPECAP